MGTAQQLLLASGAAAGSTDPSWSSVVALLHFDGSDLSSTITNEVGGGVAFAPLNSSARISTTESVFGGASLRVQSSSHVNGNPDTANAAFNFGTGDFTIEFRYRPDSVTGELQQLNLAPASGSVDIQLETIGTTVTYYTNGNYRITSASGVVAVNTWAAIALSRVSGTSRMFVNGTQVGSDYTDGQNFPSQRIWIGNWTGGGAAATGYYDEMRITKGVGRYSGNYTIATSAFPNS